MKQVIHGYEKVMQDKDYYYFYKYFSFDEKLDVLGVINNNQFKYTRPIDFNDPFDCHFSIETNFDTYTKRNVESYYGKKIKATEWLRLKDIEKTRIIRNNKTKIRDAYRKYVAITCFSNNPINMLMWSHYAKNHTGFVIELKIKKDHKLPFPVTYSENYPIVYQNWNVGSHEDYSEMQMFEVIEKIALTKSECWSYENEFRFLHNPEYTSYKSIDSSSLILKEYDPSYLYNVIAGAKICPTHYEALEKSLSLFNKKHCTNVKLLQAELADRKFCLTIPKHEFFGN